ANLVRAQRRRRAGRDAQTNGQLTITIIQMKENPHMANTDQFAQTEQEKEPMLLLDTTGSMNYGSAANDPTPRKDVIREAISLIVERLAAADSQAAEEEEGGGLRTVTFADGQAHDLGDLHL